MTILGRSEELVSRCVECDLAEPESLASLGCSAPGLVDGILSVDNVGAIWLANSSSVSERTKHVDLRAHFVRDMIKDQVIEINFEKSAENDSDIMTKNQQGQHNMYAKSKLVYTVQEMNEKRDIPDEETGRMLES